MQKITKTFWKWSIPFLFFCFTFLDSEIRQFLFGETINGKVAGAVFLSASIFKTANGEPYNQPIELNAIAAVEKALVKDPFKPSKFGAGLGRRIPQNPLQGIEIQKDRLYAVISGRKLTVGERIFGMRLINISNNKVVLAGNGKMRVYYLF